MDNSWAPVVGAAIGATAVLASQALAWLSGGRRLEKELTQREREAMLRYNEPLRDRRIKALEEFHELLQDVLESSRLSEADYLRVRPQFAFLTDPLRRELLGILRNIADSPVITNESREKLLRLQESIRQELSPPTTAGEA